ncbi:helix-turn-helix transcriptional regulator [Alicyclobacillus sp. ALC3]|nr:helix-turn-helix transcriptional regulator [Alicyclobacillus sp. ALC3]
MTGVDAAPCEGACFVGSKRESCDPNATRFEITELLLDRGKSVGELVEAVGVSQGQVSNHLACLKWCGYVLSRQEGNVLYRVTDERVRTIIQLVEGIVADYAAHISD